MRKIQRLAAVGAMAALTAVLGACSSAETPATEAPASVPAEEPAVTSEAPAPSGTGVTKTTDIFGPGCGQVPTAGTGSAEDMVDDPVFTAASNNPLLTTLVKAVTAANLGDTLNSVDQPFTVFAPADSAFAAYETKNPGAITKLTTDPDVAKQDSKLSKLLQYHVVGERYDAAGIVEKGTLKSVEGSELKIGGTATAPTVNGAPVLCGNIPTKNATVFVIGEVLSLPAESGR